MRVYSDSWLSYRIICLLVFLRFLFHYFSVTKSKELKRFTSICGIRDSGKNDDNSKGSVHVPYSEINQLITLLKL